MAGRLRVLAPHFLAMLVIYAICVIAVALIFDVQDFWVSLAIALSIALVYPSATRRFGVAPEPWQRD